MRPTNATAPAAAAAAVADGFRRWSSPVPYLFVGIAAMVGLIALSLSILACSHWKSSLNSSAGETKEKQSRLASLPTDTEPKVVVIMAGEDRPTFLAKPVPPTEVNQQV
ncbi:hypothetical protein NE237_006684 [Protea cynaroides]|uniref:Uncharacterized protein n=1 Tax=Protea cynaroides TaxID=273540 RepID=A0A9Q0QVE4_9MAGN|nr:hypothetical protein NE237_006684 [Protea cynaroides]